MPNDTIRLLWLDGGGGRGLSSLMILRVLMETIDPNAPPKPCEYFDMIGGTSTGGLIAVMLGRLRMSVDECIDAYTQLSDKVFEKRSKRIKINGQLQVRFDTEALELAIKTILGNHGLGEETLLKEDDDASCNTLVAISSHHSWRLTV
jgi:patatin-like phospholipase/acyl hydrolase